MLEKRFFGKSLEQLLCLASIFGVLQFILLTFIAGLFYPGGYDYSRYYFSDLGAVKARNGELNSLSSKIFTVTLTITAITFIPFWIIIRSLFKEDRIEIALSKIGSALGLLSSPFIIGVGMFPIDTNAETHFIVTLIFFSLFTLASFLYSVALILSQKYPSHLGIIGLILFGLSILVYMNPLAPYVAVLQNVLAYGYFIWILIPIKLLNVL